MLRSFTLLAALLALSVAYECNGSLSIDAPSDITQKTYYPGGWAEQQPLPQLSKNQQCVITVNMPTDVFATVTFYKQSGTSAGSYVMSPSNNQYTFTEHNEIHPYTFSAPQFNLNVASSGALDNSGFAFKIEYSKVADVSRASRLHIH